MEWFYVLLSVSAISMLSLIGILTLALNEGLLRKAIVVLVAMSVGALFGDAFLHLLPESYERSGSSALTSLYVLGGIFGFFVLEKFLRWRHEHTMEACCPLHPVGHINLVADGLHNFIDGVLVASSYMVSVPVGLATTIAVILHEIPQEIGDFGILIHAGFSRSKALLMNFLSASVAVVGALVALVIGPLTEGFVNAILPLTAGGFIYIAGSDLVPELHKVHEAGKSLIQFLAMLLGVGLMFLLLFVD